MLNESHSQKPDQFTDRHSYSNSIVGLQANRSAFQELFMQQMS